MCFYNEVIDHIILVLNFLTRLNNVYTNTKCNIMWHFFIAKKFIYTTSFIVFRRLNLRAEVN